MFCVSNSKKKKKRVKQLWSESLILHWMNTWSIRKRGPLLDFEICPALKWKWDKVFKTHQTHSLVFYQYCNHLKKKTPIWTHFRSQNSFSFSGVWVELAAKQHRESRTRSAKHVVKTQSEGSESQRRPLIANSKRTRPLIQLTASKWKNKQERQTVQRWKIKEWRHKEIIWFIKLKFIVCKLPLPVDFGTAVVTAGNTKYVLILQGPEFHSKWLITGAENNLREVSRHKTKLNTWVRSEPKGKDGLFH